MQWFSLTLMIVLPPNSQVEALRFTNNGIKMFWPDPFANVPHLKKLSFAQNDLIDFSPDLFTNIEGLEELDLSDNKFNRFNPLNFKKLQQLKRLYLQGNVFNNFPLEALKSKMLEELDIGRNNITDLMLPNEHKVLSGLKRLHLYGNRIKSILKDSFPENNNLEFIDLSNNAIENIEEGSFLTCTNLRELDVSQNNITFVFSLPPTVQIMKLRGNTMYNWPRFPSGIKYIDLSYNRLSDLYDEAAVNFDNLEVLNIAGNQIAKVDINNKLQKLYFLDLSYNNINDIPKSLSSQLLPNLSDLRLDGNPLKTIYFKNILAINRLYMTDLKSLEVVDEKAFSNVLGQSTGELLETPCFSLYLSKCPSLREIKVGAFDGTSLCMLDVSENKLKHISQNLTDWSTVVEGVNLQHNPWTCSCELQWVLNELIPRMYKTRTTNLLVELRCESPREIKGTRLIHWYNRSDDFLCSEDYRDTGAPYPSTMQSTESILTPWQIRLLEIIGCCIIVILVIAIVVACTVRRKSLREKRRRQAKEDLKNESVKAHIQALNRS
ncbi:hypothetical protein O3G_MSEX007471 [Manduca sexta]|uniref:LRRCT domain-containing protein n=1 Tax=Manduca sexta TaxID=7130 RepID=A0A921Z7W4_MANSE|nr:hypothetical protein O3G_MSEX007471 [Manduca sexta]